MIKTVTQPFAYLYHAAATAVSLRNNLILKTFVKQLVINC